MEISMVKLLRIICLLFLFMAQSAYAAKWDAEGIPAPSYGWLDSPFISNDGNRIYFMHTPYTILDWAAWAAGGSPTANVYPVGPYLPGAQINPSYPMFTDLFYVEWNGTTWSAPASMGSINTADNGECCIWLSNNELNAVFHRDGLSGKVNVYAHRTTKNDTTWIEDFSFEPFLWSNNITTFGAATWRADVNFGAVTNDVYAGNHRDPGVAAGIGRIVTSANPSFPEPTGIAIIDALGVDETQPVTSANELTLLFNRRSPGKPTTLWRSTRATIGSQWSYPTQVTTVGFQDPIGGQLWGELSFDSTESFAIAVLFDTSVPGWTSRLMRSVGTPTTSFAAPTMLTPIAVPSPSTLISGASISGGSN